MELYRNAMATQDLGAFIVAGGALVCFGIICTYFGLRLLKGRNQRLLSYNPLTERKVRVQLPPIQTEESTMSDEHVTLPDGNEIGRLVREALAASELPRTEVDTFVTRVGKMADQPMRAEVFAGLLVQNFDSSVRGVPRTDARNLLEGVAGRLIGNDPAAYRSAVARIRHAG